MASRKNCRLARLQVEELENRALLNATPSVLVTDYTLKIQGTEYFDRVAVSLDGRDVVVRIQTADVPIEKRYAASQYDIRKIEFRAEQGDDNFSNLTPFPCLAWGGTGSDLLSGGSGPDMFFGEDGDDTLEGNQGNDILDGGDGKDALWGGDNNDRLYGGPGGRGYGGQDVLDGGQDDDILWGDSAYAHRPEDILQQQTDPSDPMRIYMSKDLNSYASAPGVDWSDAAVVAEVHLGFYRPGPAPTFDDILRGGEGRDLIFGQDGNDVLDGSAGNDVLHGGYGSDTLNGGSGADWVDGGYPVAFSSETVIRFTDHLWGGSEADVFVSYPTPCLSGTWTNTPWGTQIMDFEAGDRRIAGPEMCPLFVEIDGEEFHVGVQRYYSQSTVSDRIDVPTLLEPVVDWRLTWAEQDPILELPWSETESEFTSVLDVGMVDLELASVLQPSEPSSYLVQILNPNAVGAWDGPLSLKAG